jgi:hypothetical protein
VVPASRLAGTLLPTGNRVDGSAKT